MGVSHLGIKRRGGGVSLTRRDPSHPRVDGVIGQARQRVVDIGAADQTGRQVGSGVPRRAVRGPRAQPVHGRRRHAVPPVRRCQLSEEHTRVDLCPHMYHTWRTGSAVVHLVWKVHTVWRSTMCAAPE